MEEEIKQDIYNEEWVDELVDNDELSPTEQAFMVGYMEE